MRKISNKEQKTQYVKYPGHEEMYIVVGSGDAPFQNAVVGVTYPFPDYVITRTEENKTTIFEYVLEGEGDIFVDGRHLHVTAGQMYLLRASEAHSYRSSPRNPWKKQWINYTAEYVSPYLDALRITTGIYDCPEAKKYFDAAAHAAASDATRNEICREITDAVHSLIFRIHALRDGVEEMTDAHRIRRALDAALYKKITLDELSGSLHISKSNVIRLFKKSYGMTPYEYLLREKLEAAKLLLSNTRLSVAQIAERLSISDAHYFSTLFYARTGMRPLEYRKNPK